VLQANSDSRSGVNREPDLLAGISQIFSLSYPVVLSLVSVTLLNLVDVAMVGRLGASSLAAVGLGGQAIWTLYGSFRALAVGTQVIVGRRFGQRRFAECGRVRDNSLVIAMAAGVLFTVAGYYLIPRLLPLFSSDGEVSRLCQGYFRIRWLATPLFLLSSSFRGFFNGIGRTFVHFAVSVVITVVNIVLNWLLIFGHGGFPPLGVDGAAAASTASIFLGASLYFAWLFRGDFRRKYGIFRFRWSPGIIGSLLRLSASPALQNLLVMTGYLVFLAVMGRVNVVSLAASNVIMIIVSISFMPGFGIGTAASILVSQRLGEGKPGAAERLGWMSVGMGVLFMGILGVVFLALPGQLVRLFSSDRGVIAVAVVPLRIMGVAQVFDALGIISSQALRGAGDTRAVMVAEVLAVWLVFVPLAYTLALKLGLGCPGGWAAMALYLFSFGGYMAYRFRRGRWKDIPL